MEVNQVKLLSLTMKLNINYDELRAQIIENAANTGEAEEVYFKLTPAQLMEYAEGKDQYVMIDLSNKVYVTPEDAENYVSASNLMQFLSSYGITDYDQLQKAYDELKGTALTLTKMQEEKPVPADTEEAYALMLEELTPTLNNYGSTQCNCGVKAVKQMIPYTTAEEIKQKLADAVAAMAKDTHNQPAVNYTTSTGQTVSITPVRQEIVYSKLKDRKDFRLDDSAMQADKAQINSRIAGLRDAMYAAARAERISSDVPLEAGMADLSTISTTAQRLFSNYKIDENGTYVLDGNGQAQLKSLRQKIVDTYYIAQNYSGLDIPQGEPGQAKETDITVRGAIQSAHNDIQKALGAEGFDTEKYLADYNDWANSYAQLSAAYDAQYAHLQELQEPQDAEKAQWYTNVWTAMGGENEKLDIQMNVTRSSADHGHAHGDYSNELSREFIIPDKNFKPANQYVVLDQDRMNDEAWLKKALEGGSVRLEKYINKKPQTESAPKPAPAAAPQKPVQHTNNHLKEYEDLKKLTRDDNSFESFL